MSTELLPCPYCGGEAHIMKDIDRYAIGCSCDTCMGFIGLGWLYETEDEAITAWNSRAHGTLTAEQVREAIERNFSKVAVLDDGKPVEWRDDWVCRVGIDYRSIADELNAQAERTCYPSENLYGFLMCCSECGRSLKDIGGTLFNYCPNCGAKVKDETANDERL